MTRSSFAMLALAAATLAAPSPGQAAPYWPWCSRYFDNTSNAESCAFSSWDQCMETVRGIGGFCFANLYPAPAMRAPPRADRSPKARASARQGVARDY
jgi:hypothetical protein